MYTATLQDAENIIEGASGKLPILMLSGMDTFGHHEDSGSQKQPILLQSSRSQDKRDDSE